MIERLLNETGVVLRREVLEAGLDDRWLLRQVKNGSLVRVRQGVYVEREQWQQADRTAQHRLLSVGVLRLYDDRVALSHISAAVAFGAPTWQVPLHEVHLTNLFGRGERAAARVRHHRGECRAGDVTRLHGHWTTAAARTALDAASLLGRNPGVCVLDWFRRNRLTSYDELADVFASRATWANTLGLRRQLVLSDDGSESVGETRLRLIMHDTRLPRPKVQYEVCFPDGTVAGTCDLALPEHRLLIEFDGMIKYRRLLRPGESITDAVVREKSREDLLRELSGCSMIRFVWADLDRPNEVEARIRRMMSRAVA